MSLELRAVRCILAASFALLFAGCSNSTVEKCPYPSPIFDLQSVRVNPVHLKPVKPVNTPPLPQVQAEPGWRLAKGISDRWTYIVIHHSASNTGGAKAFDHCHRQDNHWDELGYHFVIGNGTHTADGQVEIGSRWNKQKHGAHCKTPDNYYNDHGIGICLVGNFEQSHPTSAQLESLHKLLVFLCTECNIPPSKVTTHKSVTNRTACPGRNFSLNTVKKKLIDSQNLKFLASGKSSRQRSNVDNGS